MISKNIFVIFQTKEQSRDSYQARLKSRRSGWDFLDRKIRFKWKVRKRRKIAGTKVRDSRLNQSGTTCFQNTSTANVDGSYNNGNECVWNPALASTSGLEQNKDCWPQHAGIIFETYCRTELERRTLVYCVIPCKLSSKWEWHCFSEDIKQVLRPSVEEWEINATPLIIR